MLDLSSKSFGAINLAPRRTVFSFYASDYFARREISRKIRSKINHEIF